MTEDFGPAFVLHLDIDVGAADRAVQVSVHFLRLMHGVFPEIDVPFARLTEDGDASVTRRLFCAERIGNVQRCMQPPCHPGDHSPRWPS
jgi:hypothetical protein